MAPTAERVAIDEQIDIIARGAQAGGAKEYVNAYIKDAKDNIFLQLVNVKPDLENLLRVWAWAVGVDTMEHDLKLAIESGVQARVNLKQAQENLDKPDQEE